MDALDTNVFVGQLPPRGATRVQADVGVQVVDVLPVGASRQSQLERARTRLAARKRMQPVNELEDSDDENGAQTTSALTRFTVRDAQGAMRYLIFHDKQPLILLSAELVIKKDCEVHRDVLVARADDVRVRKQGEELSLEQLIWRLEKV